MGIGGGLELRGDAGVVPGVGRGRRLELVSAEERYTLRLMPDVLVTPFSAFAQE